MPRPKVNIYVSYDKAPVVKGRSVIIARKLIATLSTLTSSEKKCV